MILTVGYTGPVPGGKGQNQFGRNSYYSYINIMTVVYLSYLRSHYYNMGFVFFLKVMGFHGKCIIPEEQDCFYCILQTDVLEDDTVWHTNDRTFVRMSFDR